MQGRGTMIWPQGERYDGEWLDGKEHGRAEFSWPDTSFYDGLWQNGVRHGFGVWCPADQHLNTSKEGKDGKEGKEGKEGKPPAKTGETSPSKRQLAEVASI